MVATLLSVNHNQLFQQCIRNLDIGRLLYSLLKVHCNIGSHACLGEVI